MNQAPEVLCAGIIVADHVCAPIDHVPVAGELVMSDGMRLTIGGCAANAAVDVAKMGVRTAVVGRVGKDAFGRIVTDFLREAQVDTAHIRVSSTAETSQTLIVNVQGQDRRFIHSFGANAEFRAGDLPVDRLEQYRVLYVGGYLVMPSLDQAELASVFARARKAGVKTVLDVVVPGPGEYVSQLEKLLPHVDVFLPKNLEAEMICGKTDPLQQAELFHKLGAATVVITMGQDGSILYQK